MALNPTLRRLIADAQAKYADRPTCDADDDRESLSNFIGNTLERIHATPGTELVDYQQEAKNLLEQVEAWTIARHPDGSLILAGPADDVKRLF
ncbi:hypothetical protein F9K88_01780 [Brucella intermedia]|uniref:hypothetical protein n=1 Tax=Brucella TaxID=234 RepID=UPI0007C7C614|nr:hypothetical protein [Brucella intermedia]PJT26895.1 hypothetical protein CN884_00235 [Ochrobactrum sp. 30A/1000/2015]PJT38315.1 hypothetical protein CN883_10850 [Ochrobactrum sp. 27A/999/2015]PJT44334.1 hypothetical protein CN882_00235 [Ochrobactrum sp. 23A/997/2015]KAB2714350.1 hypothetical protein F9K88_01780 [Brucella intermedia]MDL2203333.1 hypothetical protein [Brucella intermedia]